MSLLPSDASTIDGLTDKQWIDRALNSFALVEPREKGVDYIRAREAWARQQVSNLESERVPRLIVARFDSYESRKGDAFLVG